MKREVLVLTGACGVGKSTIGKLWAKSKSGVCIESDYFTEWIHDEHPISTDYFLSVEEMIAELSWNTCREYLKNGFSVAIENVWTPKGLTKLQEAFMSIELISKAKFVYLKCDLDQNKSRDQKRSASNQMNERVGIVREELEQYQWPEFVHTIDSSSQTDIQTLNTILSI
ncbi:MAG: AAA family ATPase [Bacteroidota bacterium]